MDRTNQLRRVEPLLTFIFSKQKLTVLLVAMSAFGCLLLSIRIMRTGDFYFLFLPWNLFLAWVPFFLSSRSYQNCLEEKSKLKSVLLWVLWFLFYPNAPYIITDLVHLGTSTIVPKWYDSLLIFSFALTGLLRRAGIALSNASRNGKLFWKNNRMDFHHHHASCLRFWNIHWKNSALEQLGSFCSYNSIAY